MTRPNDDSRLSDDRKRFESIYEEHVDQLLAYALRRAPIDAAQDVIAETFVVAWRRLGEVPENEPLPWLYATARRVLANQRRSQLRRKALADRMATNAMARPESTELSVPSPAIDALKSLPEPQREALMLAAWEGLDSKQAAAVLGCSATAFRLRLLRARRNLAIRLRGIEATNARERLATRPETSV